MQILHALSGLLLFTALAAPLLPGSKCQGQVTNQHIPTGSGFPAATDPPAAHWPAGSQWHPAPIPAGGAATLLIPGDPYAYGYGFGPELLSVPEYIPLDAGTVWPGTPEDLPRPWWLPANWSITWIPESGDDLGILTTRTRSPLLLPGIERLEIHYGSAVHYLDGPQTTDLPPRLYENYLEFRYPVILGPGLLLDLAVQPSLHGDYEVFNDETFRVQGRVLGVAAVGPGTYLALGFLYLDREDIAAIPAGGVIWTPHPGSRVELLVPRPRIAQRVWCCGPHEWWMYLAGEFGGGSWSIERADDRRDVATYRDFRVIAGFEALNHAGLDARFEIGYVFGRHLEYESPTPELEPDDTVLVRVGFNF